MAVARPTPGPLSLGPLLVGSHIVCFQLDRAAMEFVPYNSCSLACFDGAWLRLLIFNPLLLQEDLQLWQP